MRRNREQSSFADGSMVPLYNGTQQHVKPDERLVLLAWLAALFSCESNRALLTDIKEATAEEERFQ